MAIATSLDFQLQQSKTDPGYEPIYLVELQSVGTQAFFATREPEFIGQWLAGDGLIAGGDIKAADAYPTYNTSLAQLRNEGIASISYTLDPQGFARTGDTQVQILNQELYSHITDSTTISNAYIRIRLGFVGLAYNEYITIFSGKVSDYVANYDAMVLSAVDDTIVNLFPVPPQYGADFFPRSITVGGAIPIVLGDVDKVPLTQTIGDVSGTLAFSLTALSTEVRIHEATAPFPLSGELTITPAVGASEILTYASSTFVVINNVSYLEFSDLTRPFPISIVANATVVLTNVNYQYVYSIDPLNVRRLRAVDDVTQPTVAPVTKNIAIDPSGTDHRKVRVSEFTAQQVTLIASMAGQDRGVNLVVNGEGDATPALAGWTVIAGVWDAFTPVGAVEPVIRGRLVGGGVATALLEQDIPTVAQARYRITFSMQNVDATWLTLRIGDLVSSVSVYDFGEFNSTIDTPFEFIFNTTSATTRITLAVDKNFAGGEVWAYFDHIQVYKVDTDNPANVIRSLLARHAPGIGVDDTSFNEAEAAYNSDTSRMSGVIEQTEELQALLGRIAQQFRAKTFLGEDGNQRWKFFTNSATAIARVTPSHVDKGSMRITQEPIGSISTKFFVYFNRDPSISDGALGGRSSYRGVMFASPEGTNSVDDAALAVICQSARDEHKVDHTLEVFADFIDDAVTASLLLSLIVRLNTHRRVIASWTTYLNAAHLEIGDIIRVSHPLIPPSANDVTYEIVSKESIPNGCFTAFSAAEIRQSAFNSFFETWEPETFLVPALGVSEDWEPAEPAELLFAEGVCNPVFETWEPFATVIDEDFSFWTTDTPDTFGGTGVEATRILLNAHNFESTPPQAISASREEAGDARLQSPFAADQPQPRNNRDLYIWSVFTDTTYVSGPGSQNAIAIVNEIGETRANAPEFLSQHAGQGIISSRFGQVNIELDFTLQAWVYLDTKARSMPLVVSRPVTLADTAYPTSEAISYMLWYDAIADRFKATALDTSVGGPHFGQAWFDAFSNSLTATTLGSPSVATWFHLILKYTPASATLEININDTGVDSSIIIPAFTTGIAPGASIGEAILTARTTSVDSSTTDYMGMNGRVSLLACWQRLLAAGEITSQFAGGAGSQIDIGL